MSMTKRLLLVLGNLLFALILEPIVFVCSFIYMVYQNVRYDLCMTTVYMMWIVIQGFTEGLILGIKNNIEFIKTGDLSVFEKLD